MPHLLRFGLKHDSLPSEGYPFSVPAVRTLQPVAVDVGVTFFVGENGSGKSTVLEAVASAAELTALGASDLSVDNTLVPARQLGAALRLAWSVRSRQGFFVRAEDFFGFQRHQARTDARIAREEHERDVPFDERPPVAVGGAHVDEVAAARFVSRYDNRSHGETFLEEFSRRVKPRGLYLLDEPEAPLSPKRQIEFVKFLVASAGRGAQFVIATHSPILLACPGARIYTFDDGPVRRVAYDDLEHVTLTRAFLNAPERFLGER